jgi:anti-sigma-K factor RskA
VHAEVKYRNEQIREALAAEYALGTLQGSARRRFERSLKDDPGLRRLVVEWQTRLAPLDDAVQPIAPRGRVWQAIRERIGPASRGPRFWNSIGFWRGTALASTLAAAILVALLAFSPPRETMVVVMSDDQSRPAITVSWRAQQIGEKRLRVRVIGHQTMDPDTAWELWMIPPGGEKPVSLGLITTHETQSVVVPPQLRDAINSALALAMSVEPAGGSPTGQPTGPVLYQGRCIEL